MFNVLRTSAGQLSKCSDLVSDILVPVTGSQSEQSENDMYDPVKPLFVHPLPSVFHSP